MGDKGVTFSHAQQMLFVCNKLQRGPPSVLQNLLQIRHDRKSKKIKPRTSLIILEMNKVKAEYWAELDQITKMNEKMKTKGTIKEKDAREKGKSSSKKS